MGGFSYDRDDYGSSSSWSSSNSSYKSSGGGSYSGYAATKMSASSLSDDYRPNHHVKSNEKYSIVIIIDVTGSNRDLAKILYDKMPMMYGNIEQKGYCKEGFDILVMAVGDEKYDDYPLQVGKNFSKGVEIDANCLEGIVQEGGGGGNSYEGYPYAAAYLNHYFDKKPENIPIVFFCGDEKAEKGVESFYLKKLGMDEIKEDIKDVWTPLRKKMDDNVFMLLGKYSGSYFDTEITNCWKSILNPEKVVKIEEEMAVADTILGIISMLTQSRDLDSYKVDMLDRGQTQHRIESVSNSLKSLSTALSVVNVTNGAVTTTAEKKTTSKAKRL